MNETRLAEFRTRLHQMADDLARQNERGQESQKTVTLDQHLDNTSGPSYEPGRLSRSKCTAKRTSPAAKSPPSPVSNKSVAE